MYTPDIHNRSQFTLLELGSQIKIRQILRFWIPRFQGKANPNLPYFN